MRGGAGNDTYYVDNAGGYYNAGDIVDESVAGSSGWDRVYSTVSIGLWDAAHFKGDVEMAVLVGSANLDVAGNALGNLLVGNPAATASTAGPAPTSCAGWAAATPTMSTMPATSSTRAWRDPAAGHRVYSTVSIGLWDAAHFKGDIEMAVLVGSDNLNVAGNALGNVLVGNSGSNSLNGRAGADIMRGLGGSDTYYVDNAGDIVNESVAGSSGWDPVHPTMSISLWDSQPISRATWKWPC